MSLFKHRALLKNKNFLFLWLEQIFTQFSYNLINFALIVSVFKLTRSNLSVGILLLCFYLPSAVFVIIAGLTSDMINRKKIIVVANLIWATLVIILFFARQNFLAICVIAVLIQITDEFFYNANAAVLPCVVDKDQLLTANSIFSTTYYICLILGSLSVGVFSRFVSPGAPFIVSAVLVYLGAFFTAKIKFEQKTLEFSKRKTISEQISDELIRGWQFIKNNKTVKTITLFLVFANSLMGLFLALAPGLLATFGIEAEDASFVLILPLSLGLLAASLFLSKFGKKYRRISLIQKGILAFGLLLLLFSFIPRSERLYRLTQKHKNFENVLGISLPLAGIVAALGLCGTFIFVPTYTTLQENIPEDLRGRTASATQFLIYVLSAVLSFSSGFISDNLGFFPILLSLSVISIFLGLFSRKILIKTKVLGT